MRCTGYSYTVISSPFEHQLCALSSLVFAPTLLSPLNQAAEEHRDPARPRQKQIVPYVSADCTIHFRILSCECFLSGLQFSMPLFVSGGVRFRCCVLSYKPVPPRSSHHVGIFFSLSHASSSSTLCGAIRSPSDMRPGGRLHPQVRNKICARVGGCIHKLASKDLRPLEAASGTCGSKRRASNTIR